ncbi:FecR family protein [Arenibacter sp. BSSL-BM3]|uniref:FecR family protein n=1 Tax=Arenibacter arenosicollis TaxID=2762274 RepID=A0ABR7QQV1_9FLAO|nr:FecR domain-containing protein [Arenibacter arenosicollis]MBC8769563.1 FecR family protein [Arenibacter arenosicollis]
MKKNITKLLLGTITEKEIMELRNWLKDLENQSVLESYVRDYHDLNLATLESNLDDAYHKVAQQIDSNKRPIKRLFPIWSKYAAAIVLLFGLGFLFQQGFLSREDLEVLAPKDESITLELSNGTIQTIDIKSVKEVKDSEGNIVGTQKQNQISYSQVTEREELVFNTLKIPNGKKFQLELSDGTLVHLNAGSSLRYPVNFLEEGPRQVYLSGEAYFDVTSNALNPFIVNVDELDVMVLGTEFNISAYAEDGHIDVVLVEGSVGMNKKDQLERGSVELSPGQKGTYEQDSKSILVDKVNTSLYTSWMQGHLVFRDLTFDSILKKLERHYNIEIVNTNVVLGKEVFNARFDNVEIEEVLGYFNDIHSIDFRIQGNKVIIK